MQCPYCGAIYSNKATVCPSCGYSAAPTTTHKPKRSIVASIMLVLAFFAGAYYTYYLMQHVYAGGSDASADLGTVLAQAVIMPHMAAVGIGTVLCLVSWLSHNRGFALAGAILYTIAMVAMPIALQNVVIPAALCYIAYAVMGRHR